MIARFAFSVAEHLLALRVARYIGQPFAEIRFSPPLIAPTPTLPRARRKGGSGSLPCLRGKSLPLARTGVTMCLESRTVIGSWLDAFRFL